MYPSLSLYLSLSFFFSLTPSFSPKFPSYCESMDVFILVGFKLKFFIKFFLNIPCGGNITSHPLYLIINFKYFYGQIEIYFQLNRNHSGINKSKFQGLLFLLYFSYSNLYPTKMYIKSATSKTLNFDAKLVENRSINDLVEIIQQKSRSHTIAEFSCEMWKSFFLMN